MKRKILFTGFVLLGVVLLIVLIGFLLPKERVFVKEAVLHHPIDKVFSVVTNFNNQPDWRPDLKEIKVIDDQTWTEIPQKGTPITFQIKRRIENRLFEIEIVEPKSFNGYWVGTFEPLPDQKTKVMFKEVIRVDNPFVSVLSYIFVDLDKTMDEYLKNLIAHLGT